MSLFSNWQTGCQKGSLPSPLAVKPPSGINGRKRLKELSAGISAVGGGISRSGRTAFGPSELILAESEKMLRLDAVNAERLEAAKRLEYLEDYWGILERDSEHREKALAWIDSCLEKAPGISAVLDELAGGHIRAFLLTVTVCGDGRLKIRWLDDSVSEAGLKNKKTKGEDYGKNKI